MLYGGGGFGREVALLVRAINRIRPTWDMVGFLDDGRTCGDAYHDLPFLGGLGRLATVADHCSARPAVAICIGSIEVLHALPRKIRCVLSCVDFPTLVHPSAIVDYEFVNIGEGNIIAAGVSITSDVRVGSFNIINLNAVVSHDVVIGDRCRINPAAVLNGGVRIGDAVTIGAGAVLKPRITVGNGATVALGAVVGNDVLPGTVVAGNPSRVVRREVMNG